MTAPWKRAEKKAAGLVDGKRHVRTSRFESAPDADSERFSVETKWRARLPRLLTLAMRQAERFATARRLPLVVVYEKRRREGFAILRTSDFRALFRALQGEAVEPRRRRARKGPVQVALFAESLQEAATLAPDAQASPVVTRPAAGDSANAGGRP